MPGYPGGDPVALSAEVGGGADGRWWLIEDLLLRMRTIWFGAEARPFHCGRLLAEPDGELVGMISGPPEEVEQLLAEAYRRRAYVITTPFSRPADLPQRLRRTGYHLINRQGTYIYTGAGEGTREEDPPGRNRRLLSWLRRPVPVSVSQITADELPVWNHVCYEAFGPRGQTETESLAEKLRAFHAMGARGRWYLAWAGKEPAGCAILFQGDGVAQVLAVGTMTRYRGRGLATAVVRRAILDWEGQAEGFLFLDTRPGSQAERIYQRMGFAMAYLRSVYAP